jgi:hypothetical protein
MWMKFKNETQSVRLKNSVVPEPPLAAAEAAAERVDLQHSARETNFNLKDEFQEVLVWSHQGHPEARLQRLSSQGIFNEVYELLGPESVLGQEGAAGQKGVLGQEGTLNKNSIVGKFAKFGPDQTIESTAFSEANQLRMGLAPGERTMVHPGNKMLIEIDHAQNLLKADGIPCIECKLWLDVEQPIMTQPKLVQTATQGFANQVGRGVKGAPLPDALKRAVRDIFKKMVAKNIIWIDPNTGNIWLQEVSKGNWVAGVTDADFIGKWGALPDRTNWQLKAIERGDSAVARASGSMIGEPTAWKMSGQQRLFRNTQEVWQQVLVEKGWIKCANGVYSDGMMDLAQAREVLPDVDWTNPIDLRNRTPAVPPAPPGIVPP